VFEHDGPPQRLLSVAAAVSRAGNTATHSAQWRNRSGVVEGRTRTVLPRRPQRDGVGVQTRSKFDFAKPVQLFASPYLHQRFTPLSYDVAADRRFIMLKQANTTSTPTPFTVVVNWRAAGH
jgi:hypothetical protein